MTEVFVDTNYLVAKINQHDQWHESAIEAEYQIGVVHLVTTESVLIEVLNYFSSYGAAIRSAAIAAVRRIMDRPEIEVVKQRADDFLNALALYEARPDKDYSLTDCVSMKVMHERGITDVLTHDRNFAQEGFNPLL
jgi:uncharacterized protein